MAARAESEGLIVVTADTDFAVHLALRRATNSSVVLLRRVTELAPDEHAARRQPASGRPFRRAAIVSLGPDHLRVRHLAARPTPNRVGASSMRSGWDRCGHPGAGVM
jgi:hypothetical protein